MKVWILSPCPVTDWNDERRKARLRTTRLGRRWRRFGRSRRLLARAGLALIPVMIVSAQYWVHDVYPEQQRLAQTQPALHHIYDAAQPADQDTAVVDLVGLGNLDASDTARALPAFAKVGQVWAVQYDNAGIDTAVISRMIAEHAEQRGVERLLLAGHSMGGIIALEVAQHIIDDTELSLLAVVLDCTPIDLHAVRPAKRDAGEDMLRWMGWLPGARESRTLRFAVETAARRDRFLIDHPRGMPILEPNALVDAIDEVFRDKIFEENTASNSLIEAQFLTIVASGAADNLVALSRERDDKPRPAIVFMRPHRGILDDVVDVDYSQRAIFDRVGGPGGALFVARMYGTGHANPIQQPYVYNETIEARILPFVTRFAERSEARAVTSR
ncbi:alpha/beta hydrolase [Hoyosella altamirensis]|uniref:Pimeloyl-ACP methyl ester carboxylesterase n=1 Tax=Hoyosella altamirensis TaxID=616997 RepID=A0A839RPI4_9ACTN|nr:alpha/beta hydrolase [Hoyosella altamirensis]MBB3037903.1 pimeloyl-ACP methyl ester carboxylesterase [Hoyosella altamirensis]